MSATKLRIISWKCLRLVLFILVILYLNIHTWSRAEAALCLSVPNGCCFYVSQRSNTLQLLMTSLHLSLNRITWCTPSLLKVWHSAHRPSATFVTHCAISSQMAAMATLKIAPVNRSENVRWLSAAVCPPTTPHPPPLPSAQHAVKPCEHHFPLIKFVYKGN